LKLHLHSLIRAYNEVHLVNLVNHKGHELPIKDSFERNMLSAASDPEIAAKAHYLYFDFHTECKGMRFDRISLLIDILRPGLDRMGWFHSSPTEVRRKQSGVVRSNCMDCLDRTNVSQSALGLWAVNSQLREAGLLSVKERVEEHPEFMAMFRTGTSLPEIADSSLGGSWRHRFECLFREWGYEGGLYKDGEEDKAGEFGRWV
jgi:hypothetical protein